MQEGIWFQKTTAIPADRISVVASVRPFLLRPFGVCLIEADTPAGSRRRADFRLYLSAADTRALVHTHSDGDIDLPEQQQYRPRNASVLLLSLFTSNSLMGLILLAAALQNLGDIVGEDLSHRLMTRLGANLFFRTIAGGAASALAAVALTRLGVGQNQDLIIIGALMALVPGIAMTNAMRDIMAGDMVAGISKAAEALLIGAAIALGTALALGLTRMVTGGAL